MSSHIFVQDPSNLSSRFSNEDRLGYSHDEPEIDPDLILQIEGELAAPDVECIPTGGIGANQALFDSMERYLRRIPDREADLITLYYRDGMRQEQIGKLFSITQAAVSYRLHRGIKRIQFLRTIPELARQEFDQELAPRFSDQDGEILWLMYETTCQSKIAKILKLTQGRVRHRFFRALTKIRDMIAEEVAEKKSVATALKKHGAEASKVEAAELEVSNAITGSTLSKYFTVYSSIADKNFNILNEVSIPQFKNRGDSVLLTVK